MHVDLPGGSAELADIRQLMPSHQDDYQDLRLDIVDAKEKAAQAALIAANPAAMPDPNAEAPAVRLLRRDLKPVYDFVCQLVVQDISFPGVLPWDAGSRDRLCQAGGLVAWNALLNALDPHIAVLNGSVPKESLPSATTSASTSSGAATAPQEGSAPASSATPAG